MTQQRKSRETLGGEQRGEDNNGIYTKASRRTTPGSGAVPAIVQIPIGELKPNPHQPRRAYPSDDQFEEHIAKHGVRQPILVAMNGDGGYVIVAGHRRHLAAIEASFTSIPAIMDPRGKLSDQQLALAALSENVQRRDLTPLDQAEAYRHALDDLKITREELAHETGESIATIDKRLALLKANGPIRAAMAGFNNPISPSAALEAGRLDLLDRVLATRPPNAPEADEPAWPHVSGHRTWAALYADGMLLRVGSVHAYADVRRSIDELFFCLDWAMRFGDPQAGLPAEDDPTYGAALDAMAAPWPPLNGDMSDEVGTLLDPYTVRKLLHGKPNAVAIAKPDRKAIDDASRRVRDEWPSLARAFDARMAAA